MKKNPTPVQKRSNPVYHFIHLYLVSSWSTLKITHPTRELVVIIIIIVIIVIIITRTIIIIMTTIHARAYYAYSTSSYTTMTEAVVSRSTHTLTSAGGGHACRHACVHATT